MAGSADDGERCARRERHRRAAVLHPLRAELLRLVPDDGEVDASWLAAALDMRAGRIVPHLRVLTRQGALRIVPRRRPAPPLYRHPSDREWVRKLLDSADAPEADED